VSGSLGPFDATIDYRLEGEGRSTRLHNDVELDADGAVRLIQPLLAGRIRREVSANLEVLKSILEIREA
jgi:hypothetical protein